MGGEMTSISKSLVDNCKGKLLTSKEELLNRVLDIRKNLYVAEEKGGDEADQTVRVLNESEVLGQHDRIRKQLFEIEQALARIENGTYGICEETDEYIESDRLLAIPWTRLSIEGAEIRESLKRKYAR
jgi:DnaK suppressor protein